MFSALQSTSYTPAVVLTNRFNTFDGQMVMQLRWLGYRFSQIGGSFVVHYPHLDSASRMHWNESPKEMQRHVRDGKVYRANPKELSVDWTRYKRGQVDATFVAFRRWLRTEVTNETRVPWCEDAEDDDSRLWVTDVDDGTERPGVEES